MPVIHVMRKLKMTLNVDTELNCTCGGRTLTLYSYVVFYIFFIGLLRLMLCFFISKTGNQADAGLPDGVTKLGKILKILLELYDYVKCADAFYTEELKVTKDTLISWVYKASTRSASSSTPARPTPSKTKSKRTGIAKLNAERQQDAKEKRERACRTAARACSTAFLRNLPLREKVTAEKQRDELSKVQ